MVDKVEVWRVRGQVFQLVLCLLKLSLHGRAFMERCVVHYNHALGRQFRQQILLDPGGENFRVDIPIEGTQGQQGCSQHNVCSSSSSPNKKTKTPVPLAGIAMKSGHIVGKATFVNVHNGPCFLLIGSNLLLERLPELSVCPRMAEEFYTGQSKLCERVLNPAKTDPKFCSPILDVIVWILLNFTFNSFSVQFCWGPLRNFGNQGFAPTHHTCFANTKPLRNLLHGEVYFLPNRQNFFAKIKGIHLYLPFYSPGPSTQKLASHISKKTVIISIAFSYGTVNKIIFVW